VCLVKSHFSHLVSIGCAMCKQFTVQLFVVAMKQIKLYKLRNCEQVVRVTNTGATWDCVYLRRPGVMATLIVQTAVTNYLAVTLVSYFCPV